MQTSDSPGCFGKGASSSAVLTVARPFLILIPRSIKSEVYKTLHGLSCVVAPGACRSSSGDITWQWPNGTRGADLGFSLQNEKNEKNPNPPL